MTSRREFLTYSAASAAAFSLGLNNISAFTIPQDAKAPGSVSEGAKRKLKILFLGGTGFLGPQQVDYAMKRGHEITLFNRGKTQPHLFPNTEKLHGDRRKSELDELKKAVEAGRKWDVVMDNSGYVPREVREAIDVLKNNINHYIFISTISVYAPGLKPGMDETAPVATMENPNDENVNANYGALKALCEQAAEKGMPGHATNIRPTLIVGTGDPTDRFTYWPVRLDRGGDVLCPGDGEDPIQIIDVKDLAKWCIHVAENNTLGTFNAAGPEKTCSMKSMLESIQKGIGSKAKFVWVPEPFLTENKVSAWQDMPVWIPRKEADSSMSRVSIARAVKSGLTFSPMEQTAKDTLEFAKTRAVDTRPRRNPKPGLTPERETELLKLFAESTVKK
ncbi:MAG: NAD-dependent epimerase/dehydratase family protein [Planctomycetota bacterium]